MSAAGLQAAIDKMTAGGVDATAIDVFAHYYAQLEAGETGIVAEADIEPLIEPDPTRRPDTRRRSPGGRPRPDRRDQAQWWPRHGMGMDKAKSLLPVRGGLTFLDIVARQVLHIRQVDGRAACR